ncbi:hypothetical protein LSH36_447g00025 [Paralvinella palmiformis]|uniref:Uncharacterized protein n=1 Tax=Paralvinella palmiformis TaxID=53620 RepID=A0AAD9JBR0_9ANNE|nr:hypothetical protein LSH36_447g00025 [Paralvinella palmiformis]
MYTNIKQDTVCLDDSKPRWEEYSPYKYPVKGTRFLAFKVPLEQSICFRLPKDKWLRPNDLLELLDKDNYKLGLIIDLTNTARYYKPEFQYLLLLFHNWPL